MAGEWTTRSFGDCAVLVRDTVSPADAAGSPYIGLEHISEGAMALISHGKSDDVTSVKSRFRRGDILFGKLRPYFRKVIRAPFDGVCSTDIWVVRPGKSIDAGYLFYWMASTEFVEASMRGSEGTKMPRAQWEFVSRIERLVPPLSEQRAIAHILGTLDDKIELNRRMNETLEAMARAIFKSWFVDFAPVRAKAEGRDSGLPQPLADLFPDSFEDSELGEIPEGWEAGTLADFASLNPETWSKDTRPDVINYVDLSNTKWGRIEAVTAYPQQDAPSRAQRVLRRQDTIVGTVRPGNGSYAFVAEDGLTGSTGFAVLRPHKGAYAEFVYLVATAMENIEALSHLADGGAYPAVRPEVVAATQVIRADDKVLAEFSKGTAPLLARMAQNERESRTLAALRDTLLPKLLAGEIRVKNIAW